MKFFLSLLLIFVLCTTNFFGCSQIFVEGENTPPLNDSSDTNISDKPQTDTPPTNTPSEEPNQNKNFIHLSFDDVTACFSNLAISKYTNLFDEPFFAKLKTVHDTYGAKFSLYTYNSVLEKVPTDYSQDFSNNSSWLKIGFHSNASGLSLANATYDDGKTYWNNFVSQVTRICGTTNNLDRLPRLEFFAGSKNALLGMRDANYGAFGFLSSDDNRLSYYFDNQTMEFLFDNDFWIDEELSLNFLATDVRADWWFNFSTTNEYKAPIKNTVYEELVFRSTAQSFENSFNKLIFFTHEWLVYNGNTVNDKFDTVVDACRFASDMQISFDYPQNLTF